MGSKIARILREKFRINELSPEEYAGRFSHQILCLGIKYDQHNDPELEDWLNRLKKILGDEERLVKLRRKYLSQHELEAIKQESFDEWLDEW